MWLNTYFNQTIFRDNYFIFQIIGNVFLILINLKIFIDFKYISEYLSYPIWYIIYWILYIYSIYCMYITSYRLYKDIADNVSDKYNNFTNNINTYFDKKTTQQTDEIPICSICLEEC